jgi:hypothetical protein
MAIKNYIVCSPSLFYLLVHSRCRGCLFSLDHTQTHTTVGRTPLDEGSARRRDLYLTTQTLTRDKHPCPWWDSNPRSQQALGRDLRLRQCCHWDKFSLYLGKSHCMKAHGLLEVQFDAFLTPILDWSIQLHAPAALLFI